MTTDSKPGLISSVLNWLRKGYPEGVPTTDYFPLLALLRRRLTDPELDRIVTDLTSSGHLPVDRSVLADAIARVADQEPTDEDIRQVASRLAAAGWPLAGIGHEVSEVERPRETAGRPALLSAIVKWLREGYPEGVPPKDYIPLVALLRRRLSDSETEWVAHRIVAAGDPPAGPADIGVLITKVTNEIPSDEDINRVRAYLDASGWPVVPLAG